MQLFLAQAVGKKRRSGVVLNTIGIPRSLGYALGPVLASILVYVDFNVGELTIDRETNPGWTIATLAIVQTGLVLLHFPREGAGDASKTTAATPAPEATRPWAMEDVPYALSIVHVAWISFVAPSLITSWEVAATKIIQTEFNWSIQWSALAVGGFTLSTVGGLLIASRLAMRYEDRLIMVWAEGILFLSSAMLYQYGEALLVIPYLVGSVVFMNAVTLVNVFVLPLSSKVSRVVSASIDRFHPPIHPSCMRFDPAGTDISLRIRSTTLRRWRTWWARR